MLFNKSGQAICIVFFLAIFYSVSVKNKGKKNSES